MLLEGRVAIVTGGRRGIGFGIAETFAREGARVVITGRNLEESQKAADLIRSRGYQAEAVTLDVTRAESCATMVGTVMAKHQHIDILVNNAGFFVLHKSEEMPESAWHLHIEVMLTGVFLCSQAVARSAMIPQRQGNIVNIGSICSAGGWPMRTAYDAAKAGVVAVTRDLACEWAQHNIRVNCVSPGVTKTDMTDDIVRRGIANTEMYCRRTPMGRLAEVQEIADSVLFLASDRASCITGTDLVVDGGWLPWANPHGPGFPEGIPSE